MRTRSALLAVFLFAGLSNLYASEPEAMLTKMNKGTTTVAPVGFEENKGQVRTTNGDPAPFVRYRLSQGNTHIFLLEHGIAYQFNRQHFPAGYEALASEARHNENKQLEFDARRDQVRLETFRMDMVLEGAVAHPRITTEGRSADYTNYYNHDVLDVHAYAKVIYHDVYPGIDWVVYTTEEGMKYDFIVQPGADPDMIRLRFKDHEELYVDANGNLVHGNRLGRFIEHSPVSLQGAQKVGTHFILNSGELRFALNSYDHAKSITIDPARAWGTYYGGSGADWGYSSAVSPDGSVFLAGETYSTNDGIAYNGHQMTFGGDFTDAFLVKFDSNGNRLWGTYYGGDANDYGYACATDGDGNVYLAGKTSSSSGISENGHQNIFAGGAAFLVKFNSFGIRLWGTYYGDGGTSGRACAVDAAGNVYLAGITTDTQVGVIADNGHQSVYGGGGFGASGDAYLVKFSPDGLRLWGTYYGGAVSDRAGSCIVDDEDNIYLVGTTRSTNAIALNGHQNSYGGHTGWDDGDAFLAKFSSAGVLLWGTYFGGSGDEVGYCCAAGPGGEIYLCGSTPSLSGIASGGFQNYYGGGDQDAFLSKFDANGLLLWATYYGGPSVDNGYSCSVDPSGNVFFAGSTRSLSGIADNGYQNTHGGGDWDAFLVKFNTGGTRLWGMYYGGNGWDDGYSCSVGPAGLFLAGVTGTTTTNVIAQNGHLNTNTGGVKAYLVKFDVEVGIGEGMTDMALQIYPNPTNGHIQIRPSTRTHAREVLVGDASGRVVFVQAAPEPSGIFSIDLSAQESGLYFVQIVFVDGTRTIERVVKE